jgi:two-component system chemotaxis response regulator CheB
MTPPSEKVRVLVVDDSAVARHVICGLLGRDSRIDVVGVASDPYAAWEAIGRLRPDVLTLDVVMPRMDGLSFLEKLMRARPMPVVMVSTYTAAGCAVTLRALELGAVDFVTKPRLGAGDSGAGLASDLVEKVMAAAHARVHRTRPAVESPSLERRERTEPALAQRVIALGASTGGPQAIRAFLQALPPGCPGVVAVQHMPETFTRAFADRLDGLCTVRVREAEDGAAVLTGSVLLAPGGRHMRLTRSGNALVVRLDDGPAVNRHRPSVDALFHSCAAEAARDTTGILMTGMGRDGAEGLLAIREAGGRTLAQDESSCVVYGMPKAAVDLGAAERTLPLEDLAPAALAMAAEEPPRAPGRVIKSSIRGRAR